MNDDLVNDDLKMSLIHSIFLYFQINRDNWKFYWFIRFFYELLLGIAWWNIIDGFGLGRSICLALFFMGFFRLMLRIFGVFDVCSFIRAKGGFSCDLNSSFCFFLTLSFLREVTPYFWLAILTSSKHYLSQYWHLTNSCQHYH